MLSERLDVLPPALRAASAVIAGHAVRVEPTPGPAVASEELSSIAAGAFDDAFGAFAQAVSQRLSSGAGALVAAAGSFAAMEVVNCEALASIAPTRQM
jgi:hypothetical protein